MKINFLSMENRRVFAGEFIGTFLMIFLGCGIGAGATLFDVKLELMNISLLWGVSICIAVYVTRHLSCAHFNPAITLAMVTCGRMSAKKIPVYVAAQFLGAFLASCLVYFLFRLPIEAYESANGIIRGSEASASVAAIFGCFYRQPEGKAALTMPMAMLMEGIGTFLLVFIVLSLTESCNVGRPDNNLSPMFVGLAVATLICFFSPFTQAGFNPARDFAPRLVTMLFGWGKAALPDATGGVFFVYILSPVIGAQLAALLFTKQIEPLMKNAG